MNSTSDPAPRPSAAAHIGLASGDVLAGRYIVETALGTGGMASVWGVRERNDGRRFAIKRLAPGANRKLVALFEREFHTLASLRHPSVVEAYDYGTDESGPYYTMEWLEGGDISDLAPMPWVDACKLLRDVASGLAVLHARRLLHRDLSARNVWRTQDGRIKLIDFGTLAPFGTATDVAGTAPFLAPESLHGVDLDHRTDLYSLGALGYLCLTGRHAYPARSFTDLEDAWRRRPCAVSELVASLSRPDLPEVPRALDDLIVSLLSLDPLARPASAADLIDRLTVIASLEPHRLQSAPESYLNTPAFVARDAERASLRSAFQRAHAGQACSVVVEAHAGGGRSRLLDELALEARLAGACVLKAPVVSTPGTHDVAEAFSLRLLQSVPRLARMAAAPYRSTLGHLSPKVCEALDVQREALLKMPPAYGEARMRLQGSLRDWFLEVARQRTLVLVADDLETFDEASVAWLAALVRMAGPGHKLLVVSAVCSEVASPTLAVRTLRRDAESVSLLPLSEQDIHAMIRSIFGDAPHLARLANRIHARAGGLPGLAVALLEHLGREGVIAYANGAWLLPQTLAEQDLPSSRRDADMARIERLPEVARRLARALSVRRGAISVEMCVQLGEMAASPLFSGLTELVRAGVLEGAGHGYRFARESVRVALSTELEPAQRARAHARLGRCMLELGVASELQRLHAGVHLLLGGDEDEGSRQVALAGRHYGLVDLADLGPAVPALEVALAHFDAAQRPAHETISLLAPLALGGYYADRRLAEKYGERAVATLERVVKLHVARRLQRFLGGKLGLMIALLWAVLGFAARARNPRVPKFGDAMLLLFNCVAALTGASAICIDPTRARRYARVLDPMAVLGPHHVATFMHGFCMNLVATVQDHAGDASARWQRMIEVLDRPETAQKLPDHLHGLYLGGALYARGVSECWRDDSDALGCAERLERLGLKLYDMSADQVRMMYHANRGDLQAFEHFRDRVEMHAIARGTAWQVETWTFAGLVTVHLRTGDVAGLKDCVEHLRRLSADVPSLVNGLVRAELAYLVVRGTPAEALRLYEEHPKEVPLSLVAWARGEAVRARANNDLGHHGVARDLCLGALELLAPEDLKYCALNLALPIELARAEAGLGELEAAEGRLQALVIEHGPAANPLTMGALHEALAGLCELRGDPAGLAVHGNEVEAWFRDTRHPALVARSERLRRHANPPNPPGSGETSSVITASSRLDTIVQRSRYGRDQA